jgi:kynurenine---oxoglutarate transaminase / cysteine-S-conjugate beta-lyase / glutamine---phenylpyruvate transaminase
VPLRREKRIAESTPFRSTSSSSSRLFEQPWDLVVDEAYAQRNDTAATPPTVRSQGGGDAIRRIGGVSSSPTVWTEFARIAQQTPGVLNLGQGFPDWLPPTFCVESLVEAVMDASKSPHQYTRSAGHPSLVTQLAQRYSVHLHRHVDPMAEVAVTVGASQALYLALQTVVSEGDEVILFEPFFDLYVNQIRLAGGTPVFVPLDFVPYQPDETSSSAGAATGGEWKVNVDRFRSALSPKTRAVILNSPHNPTGKIFTRKEMVAIARAVNDHDNGRSEQDRCIVISDEVYKYIVHSPPASREDDDDEGDQKGRVLRDGESPLCVGHVHVASLPGMWNRTITISSAGKTFSATGWQVGWCVGPAHLIGPIHQLLPYVQFCASTVIQEALARSLPRADEPYMGHDSYYQYLRNKYIRKRDELASALRDAGFGVPDYDRTPGGGFFILARVGPRIQKLLPPHLVNAPNPAAPGGIARQDWALCQHMAEAHGVLCIPSSPFFSPERVETGCSDEFFRIAFCKSDETILAATARIRAMSLSPSPSPPGSNEGAEHHEATSATCSQNDSSILAREVINGKR